MDSLLPSAFVEETCSFVLVPFRIFFQVVGSVLSVTKWKSNKNDRGFPRDMSVSEIEKATKGFHQDRIISVAPNAQVYQGVIPSYGKVSIKRFSHAAPNYDESYERELSACVAGLTHSNIVKLIGWCHQKKELILVYEFMSNGSLHKILHGSLEVLTWEKRVPIALGVGSALVYLHHGCINPIIHGDVKTRSIMIDSEFNANLGHYDHAKFGNSKRGIMDGTAVGVPTVKSDVYNFGLVLLELATGRRFDEDANTKVTDWVWEFWAQGNLIKASDPRLRRDAYGEIFRMLKVGL